MSRCKGLTIEVKPNDAGWYFVTMHQYKKEEAHHPDYITDWLGFDGVAWDYGDYCCHVVSVLRRDEK